MKPSKPEFNVDLQSARTERVASVTGSRSKLIPKAADHAQLLTKSLGEMEELRRRLATTQAELKFYKTKQEWLHSALAAQRHARQLLEASVSASYRGTIARIREVVRSVVPPQATLLVVSKGDQELLQFDRRRAWHFPQDEAGGYAGFYPADSAAAISQLKALRAKGGEFLLLPNTAFWWLEHYRELGEWLDSSNALVWRDERCAIYKLLNERPARNRARGRQGNPERANASRAAHEPLPATVKRADSPKAPTVRPRSAILCFPIIDWDFRFQRPQQLMRRFAAAGHKVFYLTHQFRKSGDAYSLRALAPSLWEVSLRGPRYQAYQGVLDEGHRESLFSSLLKLRHDHCLDRIVTVVQSPFWWPLVQEAAHAFGWPVVYDCMDYHAGFSTSNPVLIDQERELLSQAQLVVASSSVLQTHARPYARKVLLLRNGCDCDHFAPTATKSNAARPRPVIGYYGAIADWFDSDLVADLADRRPDWDFILVGSTFSGDVSRLSKLRNVALPGEKPYAQIPGWLTKFDVAILPFKRTPLTEAANPVKAYEILASGKPLVSVPLPEMIRLAPLARIASTVDDFEREIEAELNRSDPHSQRKRRAFARRNTWEKRFEQFSSALEMLLKPSCQAPSRNGPGRIPARFV